MTDFDLVLSSGRWSTQIKYLSCNILWYLYFKYSFSILLEDKYLIFNELKKYLLILKYFIPHSIAQKTGGWGIEKVVIEKN